jgi:hypothetical protein
MATDKYPQRNVNMPMEEGALAAARARLDPGGAPTGLMPYVPQDGKGSRREIRKGEWVDDRVMVIGSPTSSPSKDSPPEWKKSGRALPTFTAGKVYQVTLGKACIFAGRALAPAKSYQMTGETCLDPEVQPCIVDAVELGDTPVDPDVPSSPDVTPEPEPESTKAKKKA